MSSEVVLSFVFNCFDSSLVHIYLCDLSYIWINQNFPGFKNSLLKPHSHCRGFAPRYVPDDGSGETLSNREDNFGSAVEVRSG